MSKDDDTPKAKRRTPLVFEGNWQNHGGGVFSCRAISAAELAARYGTRLDEPAVEPVEVSKDSPEEL